MTGLPEHNYPAFYAAAEAWRKAGWDVANPAENYGGDQGRPYSDYVQIDLQSLRSCDAIALLPGWNGPSARGSVWERYVGEQLLGLRIYEDATQPVAPPYTDAELRPFKHSTK